MRILLYAFGTRGDIEPFLALAHRLVREGHQAVLCCPTAYRDDAERLGVGFEPMADEMDRLMRAGMQEMDGSSFSVKFITSMTAAMRTSLTEQWDAAERTEPDLIVGHPKALAAIHIAERRGIPFVASLALPFLTPTGDFPVPFTAARMPRALNRATYGFNRFTALAYGGMINKLRRDTLGLPRASRFSDYLHDVDGSPVPVLYAFSRHVVPVPADYPPQAHVTGYWFGPGEPDWTPAPELEDFLADGPPPVYVGFGSMGFGKNAAARSALVRDALDRAGLRAVVATGWGGLSLPSSERILAIGQAPHAWLFPRVAAVVHHGGSGTTAAGLRAGRPTLICPFLGDQPFWGARVQELGAGPAPLRLNRASVSDLAGRLSALVEDGRFAATAARIADGLGAEDGPGTAVRVLEEVAAKASARRGKVVE